MPQLVRASKYTLDNYERYLKNQVFPILGQLPLDEITPAQIKALLLDMQGKGYKVATCVKVYTILQGVFGLAFDEEVLTVNPMHRVKRPKPTAEEGIKTAPPAYTAEEVKAIMDAAEALPVKWRTLFLLLCETGCRRGEALGLKWGNIEQEAGTVSFVRSLGYTDKDGFFEKPPKNGRGRTVYVSPQLLKLFSVNTEQFWISFVVGNIGISMFAPSWLMFAAEYSDYRQYLRKPCRAMPVISLIFFT